MIAFVAIFLWLTVADATATHSACPFSMSQRVRIRGRAGDPDPFLWQRNLRVSGIDALREYENGHGDDVFIFLHTHTLENDTTGKVVVPCPDGDTRNIGIRVMSGPYRGQFGFVQSDEAMYPPK